mmetsp:Transcript_32699/g.89504  ORF Transcript_32699/g.89504 Transcript_32699/m.89504 type:complete len:290 (-) Transcript_32699:117-986(-)
MSSRSCESICSSDSDSCSLPSAAGASAAGASAAAAGLVSRSDVKPESSFATSATAAGSSYGSAGSLSSTRPPVRSARISSSSVIWCLRARPFHLAMGDCVFIRMICSRLSRFSGDRSARLPMLRMPVFSPPSRSYSAIIFSSHLRRYSFSASSRLRSRLSRHCVCRSWCLRWSSAWCASSSSLGPSLTRSASRMLFSCARASFAACICRAASRRCTYSSRRRESASSSHSRRSSVICSFHRRRSAAYQLSPALASCQPARCSFHRPRCSALGTEVGRRVAASDGQRELR